MAAELGVRVHRAKDADAMARELARFIVDVVQETVAARGICRLALTGGSTPRKTYELLGGKDLSSLVDWPRVDVFFGDERMVGPGDPASNYRLAHDTLLGRVPIPAARVHRMMGELGGKAAAASYEAELGREPLDLVLLGMGDDGHVASLFPGGPELEQAGPVLATRSPSAPHDRVSVSLPVINAARIVAFLVTGAAKAKRVKQVFEERASGRVSLPAARVAPASGNVHWFLDADAAKDLGATEEENTGR